MHEHDLSGLKLLVVDDIAAIRALLRGLLRSAGIKQIADARDGPSALSLLRAESFDLVITDLAMRPMDGIELTRRLRQPGSTANPFIPVLMVSGHTEARLVKQAQEAGVTYFLAKPLTLKGLQSRLKAIIEQPKPLICAQTYHGPERRWVAETGRAGRREGDQGPL
jgi:two-component system chemotaxis response regulator CheY